MNYLVVLFKNKVRKKIINKFVTFVKAKEFFDNKINNNKSIYFKKENTMMDSAPHLLKKLN